MAKIDTKDKITVTVTEAAELLSISRPTMYEILEREDCNFSFRVGTKRLISMKALQEWADNQLKGNKDQLT